MFSAIAGLAGQASVNSARKLWRQLSYVSPRKRGIDPVGEAEVFMHYGRVDDAIMVLRDTVKHDPKNTAAKVALLRAYSCQRNAKDYSSLAATLRDELHTYPVWNTVRKNGMAIDPYNPLYH
ncbi:type IV pilus assembly protein FimV [Craterilacuibacter sp.]|uniref:type IV pilus assembly protein FimV n=1 Tax=Craterilacuibacter sp. TaxID=2870909 RepID=UPI003F2C6A4F